MNDCICAAHRSRARSLAVFLLSAGGLAAAGVAAADVKVIPVDGLGNPNVILNDINNKTQTVGSGIVEATGEEHAIVWDKGDTMDLGTLGGPCSTANAIDQGGVHIVGDSDVESAPFCFSEVHAFLWSHGEMTDLGTLGGASSFAADVNKNGVVAGRSQTDDCEPDPFDPNFLICTERAFRWDGSMEDLGTLGGANSSANQIANNGWVAGSSQTGVVVTVQDPFDPNFTFEVEEVHATLWHDGAVYDLHPPGAPPGDSTVAAMTEDGTIAITVFPYDFTQPAQSYLWKNGRYEPVEPDFVDGLNEKGELLTAAEQSDGGFGPVVYGNTRTTELPDPIAAGFGEVTRPAFGLWALGGMNNRHQSVGWGFLFFLDTFSSEARGVIYDYTPGNDGGKKK